MKTISVIFIIIFFIYLCYLVSNTWTLKMDKYNVYKYINNKYSLKTSLFNHKELKNIKIFPVIIKPNLYSGHGTNVYKINDINELNNVIKKIKDNQLYIVQEFYDSKYEVGLLYEKNPLLNNGKIISIVLKQKYNEEWKPLSCDNIISKKKICYTIDRNDLITEELTDVINLISINIPNFNVGRYDIGFNNIDDFKNGMNFKIFELNGNTGIDLRCKFTNYNIDKNNFQKLLYLIRFIITRILYGFINLIINKQKVFIILIETFERIKILFNANEISHILSPSFA